MRNRLLHALGALGVAFALVLALPSRAQQSQEQGAVAVGTVYAELKPVADTADFVGRIEAIERVEIRARVKGFLEAVLFKEGDLVKEGQPLYHIEKGQFEAAVEQAKGALERSKAALALAELQRKRAEELLKRNAGTEVARDQAVAEEAGAKGAITTDEANLRNAEINLGYTDIVSPIAGKVGRTNVTKGNVVGPDSGPLTTIVSQDPMYVTFPVSQREFLETTADGQKREAGSLKVRIRFSDGSLYDQVGVINFVDVSVDKTTDTVNVRATIPNPRGVLIDGQLVRVIIESGKPEERVLIPQSALIADQQGVYVFVVEDGKAAVKRLKLGGESGTDVVVEEGLAAGAQVIVEGLQGVRPGVAVRASPMPQSVGRT
ncbi:MAG: efflux RND transporter periplasmic adaptor subunit [Xanthobacteraceae bacterium]